jgi:hypothetical protein
MFQKKYLLVVPALFLLSLLMIPDSSLAHCDTLEGPVVTDAKKALEKGDVNPVLKWVKKEQEGEIREAFKKTLAVRSKGPEAKELADRYFFETLVRIHRAGEGAPYTGLSKEPPEPIIAAVDKALEKGGVDHVVTHVTEEAAKGIRERFSKAIERKKRAEESVAAGREYVEAYVEFTHYVERIFNHATSKAEEHKH